MSYRNRHAWAAMLSLSLTLGVFCCPALANDLISVKSLSSNNPALASNQQEGAKIDVRSSIDKLPVQKNLINQDFANSDEKRQLQQLLQAQQALMQQIQVLKARIEDNSAQTSANTSQIKTVMENTQDQGVMVHSLLDRVKLNGYVEGGWRIYSHGPRTEEYLGANGKSSNSFDLRRVYFIPTVQITDKAGYYGEMEFEDAGHSEISMEESELYYNWKPWLNFATGMLIPPLTHTAVMHKSTERILIDRPLMDAGVIPTTYNDLGVSINGTIPLLTQSALQYNFMVLNGFKDTITTSAPAGTRVSDSIDYDGLAGMRAGENNTHFRDNNGNKALLGRLSLMPFPGLKVSGTAYTSGISSGGSGSRLSILTSDIQYRHKRFSLLGEYAYDILSRGNGVNSDGVSYKLFPSGLTGCFIQPAYDITDKLTAALGWNWVNLDTGAPGNKMWRFEAGLRYNPFKHVFLKSEYQFSTGRSAFPDEKNSNAFITQMTYDF